MFKRIKEGDSMLDLTKLVHKNVSFYVNNYDYFENNHYTLEQLSNYAKKLEVVLKWYEQNKIPQWFKDYNAYSLTSGDDFTYIKPYLDFCFSFNDLIDMIFVTKYKFRNKSGSLIRIKNINIIDYQSMTYDFVKVKGRKKEIITRHVDRATWYENVVSRYKEKYGKI